MDNKLATPAEALVCRANLMARRCEGSEESELFKQLAIHLSASLLATREACKERDEAREQVVNLAVENSTIKTMNDCLAEELRGYESDGAFDGPDMHKLWHSHAGALPATNAAITNIQAQGVDKLATFAGKEYQRFVGDKTLQRKWKGIVLLCTDFASQLRKEPAA